MMTTVQCPDDVLRHVIQVVHSEKGNIYASSVRLGVSTTTIHRILKSTNPRVSEQVLNKLRISMYM
jgi:transcriptional regulator of acetoin/glycerol metabolism